MKQPYEIHSDFFKKMIASGWYENREIILDSLPHHLEELPDNVKKFLREIWYLTISYDAYYRSNGRIFLSTVLHNFGETTNTLVETIRQMMRIIFFIKNLLAKN